MKIRLLQLMLAIVLIGAATLLYQHWNDLLSLIIQYQQHFHELLSDHIKQVSEDPALYGWALIGIAFLYGVFHAAGPGHGKAVLVTYLTTQRENMRQGIVISMLAALLQSLVAIGLISILVSLLGFRFSDARNAGMQVEQVGYSLVIIIGAYLTLRAVWSMRKAAKSAHGHDHDHRDGHDHDHPHHDGEHCQHSYAPTKKLNIWQTASVIFSMGLRPCSGAIVVLIYAQLTNAMLYGVIATLVIGLGTGLTVALLAVISVLARDWVSKVVSSSEHSHHHHARLSNLAAMTGGLLLMWLGWGLLELTRQVSQNHPLF